MQHWLLEPDSARLERPVTWAVVAVVTVGRTVFVCVDVFVWMPCRAEAAVVPRRATV